MPATASRLPERLGARRAAPTPMSADAVAVDARLNAGAAGLYAAGDLLPKAPSVAAAISSGSLAAAAIVGALTAA
jgi:hypothetical protein